MLRDRLKPYLPKIVSRELTNRAVAHELGVSEHYVCRVLKSMGVVRNPAPTRENRTALVEARREYLAELANSLPVPDAARAAGCSTRTIYRYKS